MLSSTIIVMLFSILPFEPESFIFPRISRFLPETLSIQDDLDHGLIERLPTFECPNDMLNTGNLERKIDSQYIVWFALLLVRLQDGEDGSSTPAAKPTRLVAEESELFSSASELKSLIEMATKKFVCWSSQPFISSDWLFVRDDTHPRHGRDLSTFSKQILITRNYLMRKDAQMLHDLLRSSQASSGFYRANIREMRDVIKDLMRASWMRYNAFL
ncbi:hypothetical protein CYMTET_36473 [Cymbomonas tetramitiformis]|uniref:Uncharacterized protein n=1 Tax=Cymbomonas tetramitiformis TaxID=36881 RepID=A0AAE0CFU2_9CHLO|nr:hypothetical protein CYMTET_36473 [Cymbomonas tetramitiformis]